MLNGIFVVLVLASILLAAYLGGMQALTQAILESTLVSAGSAGLGVLLGLATGAALALFGPSEGFPRPIISGLTAGVTFAATLAVAVVAAVAPALRVRRIEISAAVRAAG